MTSVGEDALTISPVPVVAVAVTLLSALIRGMRIAEGLVSVNSADPTVVAPNDVLPVAATNPVAPPSHLNLSV